MLDDIKSIAQIDAQDALGFSATEPEQLRHNFGITEKHFGELPIYNVVFAGMGGSALCAELARTWPTLGKPFEICKGYDLPAFVDADTLVVCSSYSGNTEETLSCLAQAEKKGAQIAIIASGGGRLAEIAHQKGYIFAQVPPCPVPRTSVLYTYRALVEILIAAKLTPARDVAELEALIAPLQAECSRWGAQSPSGSNLAKQLAAQLANNTPIIYAGPLMYPAAYKWKIGINENAKSPAWCNQYSEWNHNEFMGWTGSRTEKPFVVLELTSQFENPGILKRFSLSGELLAGMRPPAIAVEARGGSALEHMMYLVLLGDFTSIYLGILNGVDPTPVDLAEELKKRLAATGNNAAPQSGPYERP